MNDANAAGLLDDELHGAVARVRHDGERHRETGDQRLGTQLRLGDARGRQQKEARTDELGPAHPAHDGRTDPPAQSSSACRPGRSAVGCSPTTVGDPSMNPTLGRLHLGGVDLEVVRRGSGPPMLLLHGVQTSPRCAVSRPPRPARGDHRALAPRLRPFGAAGRLRHGLRPRAPLSRPARDAAARQGDAGRAVVRRLARRRDRGEMRPSPRPARPRGRARHQGQRPRDARHPRRVQYRARPRSRRRSWHDPATWAPDFDAMSDEAARRPRAELGGALPLRLAPVHVQPAAQALAGRIAVPTLVLWGASDGIVTPAYGRAYSGLIPGARFELIEAGRASPGDRAARGLRRARRGVRRVDNREGESHGRVVPQRESRIPFVPQDVLDAADSVRASLPNRTATRGSPPTCSRRCSTSILLCDELGHEHRRHRAPRRHQLACSAPTRCILGILARQTRKVRILSLGTLISLRPDPVRVAEEYATADVISRGPAGDRLRQVGRQRDGVRQRQPRRATSSATGRRSTSSRRR